MTSRPARWAGSFYPASSDSLTGMVDGFLGEWPAGDRRPWALVAPHAGYVYSGRTAAAAHARIPRDGVKRIVLIGPSHHLPLRGCGLSDLASWDCPLGSMDLDLGAAEELLARGAPFISCNEGHALEHSLEVQLPFLLRRVPGAKLLPLLLGTCRAAERQGIRDGLEAIAAPGDLWLISSDLSHFHDREEAERIDAELERLLQDGDPRAFADAVEHGRVEACGSACLQVLLEEAETRGGGMEILHRCDSSAASGDEKQVVGYLSAAFWEDC